jgi:hypothetical protein
MHGENDFALPALIASLQGSFDCACSLRSLRSALDDRVVVLEHWYWWWVLVLGLGLGLAQSVGLGWALVPAVLVPV